MPGIVRESAESVPAEITGAELQRLMAITPDVILVCDGVGVIEAVSPAIAELLGYPATTLVGTTIERLLPVEAQAAHARSFAAYAATPFVKRMRAGARTSGRHASGHTVDIDTQLMPLMIDGQLRLVAIIRDASALRSAERRLEELNREKNEFLGLAAHDLRSPIGAISGYAELLLADGPGNDEARFAAGAILDACASVRALIDDYLDVAAIEAGHLRINLQTCSVAQVLRQAVTIEQANARRKGISLAIAAPAADRTLRADPGKLLQVVQNLLSNAVKFSPAGSEVLLGFGEHAAGGVAIFVRDQGPGIAPADVERLFQPFARTSNRPTGGETSTGLGLAIVRRIVEAHGGSIRLDSQLGKGSTFQVLIPASDPSP